MSAITPKTGSDDISYHWLRDTDTKEEIVGMWGGDRYGGWWIPGTNLDGDELHTKHWEYLGPVKAFEDDKRC